MNIATKASKLKGQTESDIGHFLQSLAMFSFVCFFLKTDANTKTYWILPKVFVCVFLFVFVFVFAKTLWQWSKADVAWFLSNAHPLASKAYLFVFPHFASEHTWFTKSFGCRHPGSNCKKNSDIHELPKVAFFVLPSCFSFWTYMIYIILRLKT